MGRASGSGNGTMHFTLGRETSNASVASLYLKAISGPIPQFLVTPDMTVHKVAHSLMPLLKKASRKIPVGIGSDFRFAGAGHPISCLINEMKWTCFVRKSCEESVQRNRASYRSVVVC